MGQPWDSLGFVINKNYNCPQYTAFVVWKRTHEGLLVLAK
jgi:hypothetical protein